MDNQFYRNLHLVFLALIVFISSLWLYHFGTGWPAIINLGLGGLLGLLVYGVSYFLWPWLGRLWQKINAKLRLALLTGAASLIAVKLIGFSWPDELFYPAALGAMMAFGLILWAWSVQGRSPGSILAFVVPVVALAWGVAWLLSEGKDPFPDPEDAPVSEALVTHYIQQDIANPAELGAYAVEQFTYGSGDDQRRPEYAAGARYQTPKVDATRLLPEWRGKKKKWRERYWGFGVDEFPLNGRVYHPVGEGPFPLVLIVHGNHSMIDYSDGGYAYLGELLASRGMIVVSVDENFVNGHWSGDFRGREMPTRAWLLLKHLEQWQAWSTDEAHELHGLADMEQIMLMGHSRGGEAVSIAAAFNQLPYYPDDAQEAFDFGFSIKGIVTIAPTDYRYHRQTELTDINYLSLQGSYDADETSFYGLRPYNRLRFSDSTDFFKAGIYIHRANHGQFNSSWGRSDFGGTFSYLLNTYPMISGEDQRAAAAVFISAFAEAVFNDRKVYRSLFQTPQSGEGRWLPTGRYLGHFSSSKSSSIQDFEEDIDLSTGAKDARVQASNTAVWREEELRARDGGKMGNNVLVLGWDYGEKIKDDSLASYTLTFDSLASKLVDTAQYLLLDVGHGSWSDLPDRSADDASDDRLLDFRIEVQDQDGKVASVLLSESGHWPAPILRSRFTKLASLDADRFENELETQLETFALPTRLFQTASAEGLDWQRLAQIRLVFDQAPVGIAVIDDIRLAWD